MTITMTSVEQQPMTITKTPPATTSNQNNVPPEMLYTVPDFTEVGSTPGQTERKRKKQIKSLVNLRKLLDIKELNDVPDYLCPERRKNFMHLNFLQTVAERRRSYMNNNPTSHCKNLIDYINDFLDFHNLADIKKWQQAAVHQFYLGLPVEKSSPRGYKQLS